MLSKTERDTIREAAKLIVRETNEGEQVMIRDFGTFKRTQRKAKAARNPQTGAAVQIPAREVLAFKASKSVIVEK